MSSPENMLVIMSDEHQARALSCLGHFVDTPNLDRLAAEGTLFTRAYTPSPICVPARASFASGRPVHENRLWDNAMPYRGQPKGWGHALQNAGIAVESIGKLHYSTSDDDNGFDAEHIPMHVVGGHGMVWASIRDEDRRVVREEGRMLGPKIGSGESDYTRYDRAVTAKTVEWLNQPHRTESGEPWCLYVGLVAPHFPLIAPEPYFSKYRKRDVPEPTQTGALHPWVAKQNGMMESESKFRDADERKDALAAYYALIEFMDHHVGQVLDALEASGQAEHTTVVYTSDHGDNAGARGLWGKSNMYEESAAIPMIARGPKFAAGARVETCVDLLDLSATIVDHFGVDWPEVEGHSAPTGTPLDRISDGDPTRCVLSQYHAVGSVSGAFMVTDGRWKYIYYHGFDPELFDLVADPQELSDLSADPASADILDQMHAKLLAQLDPVKVDRQAFADQAELIESFGGIEASKKYGAPAATPPPKV